MCPSAECSMPSAFRFSFLGYVLECRGDEGEVGLGKAVLPAKLHPPDRSHLARATSPPKPSTFVCGWCCLLVLSRPVPGEMMMKVLLRANFEAASTHACPPPVNGFSRRGVVFPQP